MTAQNSEFSSGTCSVSKGNCGCLKPVDPELLDVFDSLYKPVK